uniref:Phage tail assembly chaperone-like domain-containing protein n=1 Tax=Aliivibrio wodanis TaxID=80852 RepID=A0A5Q4ZIV3_9GAMM|nr:hypothetical protein AW0309160_01825 [Aliivibrio wodanis]
MYQYVICDDKNKIIGSLELNEKLDVDNYVDVTDRSDIENPSEYVGFFINRNTGELVAPEVIVPTKEETERAWRDSEIKVCAELKQEADHPYLAEINAYLQLLRDYPSQDDFPNGERPTRPVTPSGSAIIL